MTTRAEASENDVVTQTGYNRAGKPERLLGPVYQTPSYTYGALSDAAAGSRVTRTTYDDDPLLRVSRVVPPGIPQATPSTPDTGTGAQNPDMAVPTGPSTTKRG